MITSLNDQRSVRRAVIAAAVGLGAGVLTGGTPARAQTWTGPSFREFVGTNQASVSDSLFTTTLGWNRHDVSMTSVEPSNGGWDATYMNSVLTEISSGNSENVSLLPCLAYIPTWAIDTSARSWISGSEKWSVSPNGDGTFTYNYYTLSGSTWVLSSSKVLSGGDLSRFPPANTSDWTTYITHAVSAMHAPPYNLQYFQIWNEAGYYSGFWYGSMDDYMNKVHIPAAAAIHTAGGKVVYGGWPSDGGLNNFISTLDTYSAWGSMDVLDCHYYNVGDFVALRQAADSRGYTNLGIWQTENGFTTEKTFIANNYPRTLYWALNNNWSTPDKYKLLYYDEWSPNDPGASGYNQCLYAGSTLTSHGQILQNQASLFGGGHLSAYTGITTSPAITQANYTNINASAYEAFDVGQNIVVAVHLAASDYNSLSNLTLTLPINRSQVTAAQRVDLTGTTVNLTSGLGGTTSTTLTVSTKDATGSSARAWNDAASIPRTFYVVFTTAPLANGTYTLAPACATNSRLDAKQSGTTNGTRVQIWTNSNGQNQKWVFTNMGNGQYKIQPAYATGLALDVNGASRADGTVMQLYTDNGTAAQRWYISPAGIAGYYTLMPACAGGSCLDVTGAASADGTPVELYHANYGSAQIWKIAP